MTDHDHAHHSAGIGHVHVGGGSRGGALSFALTANGLLLIALVVAGLTFGSLAVLADAAHQLSDVIGLVVALAAFRLADRAASTDYTFGLRRVEVLGAMFNAVLLLVSAGWIVFEAIRRSGETHNIDGLGVVTVAVAGLVVNGWSAWSVSRVAGANLNLQGAVIHLAADAAGSFGVLIAGIADLIWGATHIDTAVSLLIAVLIIWTGLGLLRSTMRVLLEAAPPHTDIALVTETLLAHDAVTDVHHLHVWSIDSERAAMSVHVVVDRPTLHDAQEVSEELTTALAERHHIGHATIAIECHDCTEGHPAPG